MRICRPKRDPSQRCPFFQLLFQRSCKLGCTSPANAYYRPGQPLSGGKCKLLSYTGKRSWVSMDYTNRMEYHRGAGNKFNSCACGWNRGSDYHCVYKFLRLRAVPDHGRQPDFTAYLPRTCYRPRAPLCRCHGHKLFHQYFKQRYRISMDRSCLLDYTFGSEHHFHPCYCGFFVRQYKSIRQQFL